MLLARCCNAEEYLGAAVTCWQEQSPALTCVTSQMFSRRNEISNSAPPGSLGNSPKIPCNGSEMRSWWSWQGWTALGCLWVEFGDGIS